MTVHRVIPLAHRRQLGDHPGASSSCSMSHGKAQFYPPLLLAPGARAQHDRSKAERSMCHARFGLTLCRDLLSGSFAGERTALNY